MVDKNIDKMEFEESFDALENIVKQLEDNKIPLQKTIELYELGVKLKKHCEKILTDAQLKIDKITADKDDNVKINAVSEDFLL